MLLQEFYNRFNNMPLERRVSLIDKIGHGDLTMYEIYKRLNRIEAQLRPFFQERDDLLRIAGEYIDSLPKPKLDYRS